MCVYVKDKQTFRQDYFVFDAINHRKFPFFKLLSITINFIS